MIKSAVYTYKGANQDTTRSKHSFDYYFEAGHIKILSTDSQSTGSVANEKGNELVVSIPDISIDINTNTITYGNDKLIYKNNNEIDIQIENSILNSTSNSQIIIGHANARDSIILFTTDNNMDCIWLLENVLNNQYDLKLIYLRNLSFSTSNPIQTVYNYENEIIQKVYWVDGNNQLRFLNINHSIENGDLEELIDLDSTSINISGQYDLSQPTISQITQGGIHTSGVIQYAYNLYRLNGSQTVISPLSELVPLDFGTIGGGERNEIVGASPLVQILNLDERYTHIKLYAIKYTSYNQLPQISLIVDEEIADYNLFNHFDTGTVINNLSASEFVFLGSSVFIPRHIESKDNRMFAASNIEKPFEFEIDTRAYSHTSVGNVDVWDNVTVDEMNIPQGSLTNVNTTTYMLAETNDSINPNYDLYKFQSDGITIGGEGLYIKYRINQKTISQLENQDLKLNQFLKDSEIYRIGIQFYNRLGQVTRPFWIADLLTPEGNLMGLYNTLEVEIKTSEFNSYVDSLNLSEDQKPVGYKVIRADRTINDKTIICQGGLTSMMVQTTRDVRDFNFWKQEINRKEESDQQPKLPIIFTRGINNFQGVVSPLDHLYHMNENPSLGDDDQEIFRESDTDFKRQQTWQYSKMMQMHSPDVLFNIGVSLVPNIELRVKGVSPKNQTNIWHYSVNKNSLNIEDEGRTADFSDFRRGDDIINMFGLFGPSRDERDDDTLNMSFKQYYHEFGNLVEATNKFGYTVYGRPEVTERGQGSTDYNNDPRFKYLNSLENFLTDRKKNTGAQRENEEAITGINTFGSRCVTFVLGNTNDDIDDRLSMEDLWNSSGIISNTDNDNGLLIAEFALPLFFRYVGNIYGGNTYEDKTRSSYIEIGNYSDITNSINQIDSPGDTFVQIFKIARLAKTDTEVIAPDKMQLTEILEFPVETQVNLINRNDTSLQSWDSELQPRYEDYHEYNTVYSQQPTLIQNRAESFKFRRNNSFDARVIASKLKIPGENIDSWTDFLENEIMDLDGKFGPINSLTSFEDEIFAFQDKAISRLSINPRIQVQGSDGVDIELGTGGILYDYNYLTTKSGSINKWGIYSTKKGIYYYDALNKSVGRVPDLTRSFLTDVKGLHGYFSNNFDYDLLKEDNPVLKSGAIFGYDNYNNDVYFSLLQGDKSFTWCYNELIDQFIDLKTYQPSQYINLGEKLITTNPDNNKLYEHYRGDYNKFYDINQPSYIILQVNPESNMDCVFNNILFKSEMYLDDIDQPNKTLTHIQAYNEYQDTGKIPLKLSRNLNLRRKFREWKANIPRDGRDRIRNPWIFLKLELENTDNYKLILHDMFIYYSV